MQDSGPLIALIVFLVLTLVFGFLSWSSYGEMNPDQVPEGFEGTYLDHEIQKTQKEISELEQKLVEARAQIQAKQEQMELWQARAEHLDYLAGLFEQAEKARIAIRSAGIELEKTANKVSGGLDAEQKKTRTQISGDERAAQEKADADVKRLQGEKDASLGRVKGEKDACDRAEKELVRRRDYEKSTLDQARHELDDLVAREPERANLLTERDGQVVFADPVHNAVFINIGTADGVRNGYRFECFAMRPGGAKLHKAYLEVRRASAHLSECLILTKLLRLPSDPVSDYIAKEPEELFSPYQQAGKQGALLQYLTGMPKMVTTGMNRSYPIVDGDWVQNPFFRPGKTLTFYVAGDKTITDGVQRSAIFYPWPHIERVVQYYGAKVSKTAELGVDYVIAQRNPVDDPEYNKAVTLGIPVIHEWELFRFLDQQ